MFHLVYVSSAVQPFTTAGLLTLLATSRENNRRDDITGLLLYKEGNFMQVLEGDEDAVLRLYARIQRDPRHRDVTTLLQGAISARQFPDWSMAFRHLDSSEIRSLPGYNDFLNVPLTSEAFAGNPAMVGTLLQIVQSTTSGRRF